VSDGRSYPSRPYLAVSAAIIKDGRILIVRRAGSSTDGPFTLPGGAVETGERLEEAVIREIREETGLSVAPCGFAGFREAIFRDSDGRVERHFVILAFAARWIAGEPVLNEELAEARWLRPADLEGLRTTEGLSDIVASAFERVREVDRR